MQKNKKLAKKPDKNKSKDKKKEDKRFNEKNIKIGELSEKIFNSRENSVNKLNEDFSSVPVRVSTEFFPPVLEKVVDSSPIARFEAKDINFNSNNNRKDNFDYISSDKQSVNTHQYNIEERTSENFWKPKIIPRSIDSNKSENRLPIFRKQDLSTATELNQMRNFEESNKDISGDKYNLEDMDFKKTKVRRLPFEEDKRYEL